jgi:xanthine dehydrogenase small subunit
MRDHLRLFLNGHPLDVRGEDAFLTLSDFLRKRQRLTGTKVVCAEGDCGSCSVLIGRASGDTIRYRTITSCIVSMAQLDGAHVVTVEGLKDGDELNPIQQAMVSCHGAQCGFCTPGFVVALSQILDEDPHASREKVCRGLVGNLCRCTGYDSILRAAELTPKDQLTPLHDRFDTKQILDEMRTLATDEVSMSLGEKRFYRPATMAQATAFRAANPTCGIVSGSTDWGVALNKRALQPPVILILNGLVDQQRVELDPAGRSLRIGGSTVFTEVEAAANEHLPELGRFLQWFGSPPIRNGATLAGNVATGSPIGDSLPCLMVMNAEIELASVRGTRRVNINDFYTGYRKTVMTPDELIAAVHLPLLGENERLKLYKVSKRKDLDIASFGAAIWIKLSGDLIEDVRVAFGGVAATIVRMTRVEEHLRGQTMSESLFAHAAAIAWRDIKPLSDVRGSTQYRCTLAANVMRKAFVELTDVPVAGGV